MDVHTMAHFFFLDAKFLWIISVTISNLQQCQICGSDQLKHDDICLKDKLIPHTSTIVVLWTINLPLFLASPHFLPLAAPAMWSGYSTHPPVLNWKQTVHQQEQLGSTGLSWSLSIGPWIALMCSMHYNVGSSMLRVGNLPSVPSLQTLVCYR